MAGPALYRAARSAHRGCYTGFDFAPARGRRGVSRTARKYSARSGTQPGRAFVRTAIAVSIVSTVSTATLNLDRP